jgi:uncharacterized membrane protein YbjE (DUF340 family)
MIKLIFTALFLGFLSGRLFFSPQSVPMLDSVLTVMLAIMVFCSGTDIGSSRSLVKQFMKPKMLGLVTSVLVVTNLGSLLGGVLCGIAAGLAAYDSLLVSSGLGWYSLSSILLSTTAGTEMGTMAFISNSLRELLTLLLVPLLAHWARWSSVVLGGATTMDSTMPVILKCLGRPAAILGFLNGFLLTCEVPVLIPFLLSL